MRVAVDDALDQFYRAIAPRLEPSGACWLWTGACSPAGYARLTLHGATWYVHRLILELRLGRPLARTEHCDHLCRVRRCVRDEHLDLVTNMLNNQRGLMAKLLPEDVQDIRFLHQRGCTVMELARHFAVHHSQISRILSGEMWRNVP